MLTINKSKTSSDTNSKCVGIFYFSFLLERSIFDICQNQQLSIMYGLSYISLIYGTWNVPIGSPLLPHHTKHVSIGNHDTSEGESLLITRLLSSSSTKIKKSDWKICTKSLLSVLLRASKSQWVACGIDCDNLDLSSRINSYFSLQLYVPLTTS